MDPHPPPPPKKKQQGWAELRDRAPVRQLSRRHTITRAIIALLLLAKREPVRAP